MNNWHAKVGDVNYEIQLTATRIEFSKHSGTPESYGGNSMPYPRFLRREKWQRHVSEVFGAEVLEYLLERARARSS